MPDNMLASLEGGRPGECVLDRERGKENERGRGREGESMNECFFYYLSKTNQAEERTRFRMGRVSRHRGMIESRSSGDKGDVARR